MTEFKGFTSETIDVLWGIRLNNYKEWFHENKDNYNKYVTTPIKILSENICEYMHNMDSEFNEMPKISRANRDIRFSKNKSPYKENKWFFLRSDKDPSIIYSKPTYFFEISPDWYRYGFFYSPIPSVMKLFRNKVDADISSFERIVEEFEKLKDFKIEGNEYKRKFKVGLSEKALNWYNKKEIIFVNLQNYESDLFFKKELENVVCKSFKKLYPFYKYFKSIL